MSAWNFSGKILRLGYEGGVSAVKWENGLMSKGAESYCLKLE